MTGDIIDAFALVRHAFRAANLQPPTAIHLASHDEGMRFLRAVAQKNLMLRPGDPLMGKPIEMADGSVFMEAEVLGMKVRWPANKWAMPDGTWRHI